MRLADGWVACTFTGCILKLVVYGEETEHGGKEKKLCKGMRLVEGWAASTFTGCILKQVVFAQDTLQ